MTARMLRWLLLGQLFAVLVLALAGARWLGVSPFMTVLPAAGAVLLVRLAIVANNFMMSRRYGSPVPARFALGLRGRLRLFFGEFYATMVHSSWIMVRARACVRIYPGDGAPPVLLLHGYGCNSGYWAHLQPLLDARGISHAGLDLEPTLAGIDEFVPLVARRVEELRAATGAQRVILVAHSMGGLVGRAYLRAHGSGAVARLITLGTPHHGTALAAFAPGRNAAQMCRSPRTGEESDWLRALAASETPAMRALVTSLMTHHDNIIAPQTSSVLEGARTIEFGGVGHVAMGRDRAILSCVLDEIGKARAAVFV
ncbi:esterase/lipase family protein [Pseudoduganella sp. GCM10020061]|uniref:esterase/lipase family protein n=1 Tax=Pseudoduganella sp. GCM10020061 TaxID=3317345 RepID=UPI0036358F1C